MELLKDSSDRSLLFYRILSGIEKSAETAIALVAVIILSALAAAGILGFGIIINEL